MEAGDEIFLVGLGSGKAQGRAGGQALQNGGREAASSSSGGGGGGGGDAGLLAFGLKPGAPSVAALRESATVHNGVAVLATRAGAGGALAGDAVVAVQRTGQGETGKSGLGMWSWRKERPQLRCTTPERLGPLSSTSCGAYIVGGGISGTCYLWESGSGALVRVWKAHYLPVSCLRFVDDDSHLVSAGDDAMVRVWNIGDLLDPAVSAPRQVATLASHTLAVTDLWVGAFGFGARVLSCSLDQTLRAWCLEVETAAGSETQGGRLLASTVLPSPLNCCVADQQENWAFVGAADGHIYQCALRDLERDAQLHAVDATTVASRKRPRDARAYRCVLEGHDAGVTCLGLSSGGLLLVSGSLDGTCRLWDTHAGQSIRVVVVDGGARPVVDLRVVPMPSHMTRGRGGAMQGPASEAAVSMAPLKPLMRYQSTGAEGQAQDRIVRLRPPAVVPELGPGELSLLLHVNSAGDSAQQGASGRSSVAPATAAPAPVSHKHLDARVEELSKENARWKRVNAKLYAMAVERFVDHLA